MLFVFLALEFTDLKYINTTKAYVGKCMYVYVCMCARNGEGEHLSKTQRLWSLGAVRINTRTHT